ncbi:MAG TPA: (S)-ureidoglycine aminohydrolase [Candidatus Acidoferrum sp.]|nr:(S)-ureidoglycine aminohydrolase [Candidatus Acidoferrum sp.]
MHNLGHTRSSHHRNHLLLTPDTFVCTALPGMKNASAIVHIGPALGAAFTEYTVEFETGGELGNTDAQRFIYVTDGSLALRADRKEHLLASRGYAYLPQGKAHRISSREKSCAIVVEKHYVSNHTTKAPSSIVGSEDTVASEPLDNDPTLQVKHLLPDTESFDFAVNTMTYQPGAALSMVEMHVMEHGLMMLEGGGIYRLGDAWYQVTAGDFIWMGPWCPQWFGAIGKVPAKYLIYKNWNRHPLTGARK